LLCLGGKFFAKEYRNVQKGITVLRKTLSDSHIVGLTTNIYWFSKPARRLANVARMQEEVGTGGAGIRFMHAAFLQKAAELVRVVAGNDGDW